MSDSSDDQHDKGSSEDHFFRTFASDFARLATGFATVLQDGKEDLEDWYWSHLDKRLAKMSLPSQQDWEALLLMMKRLRQVNKDCEKRIKALEEACLPGTSPGTSPKGKTKEKS